MASRFWNRGKILLIGLTLLLAYLPQAAEALPAWARKYGKKCTVCHVQFPKLKNFGIAFKNRGYRMEDEKGEYIWKSKNLPVGIIGSFDYTYQKTDVTGTGTTRTGQINNAGVELFAGGTLAPRISFFVDALTADNRTLVQFDDILADSALNIKVGDFNVDNYFLSRPRRLTATGYLVKTGPQAPGDADVTFANQGFELNGQFLETGFRYAVGVGNDADASTGVAGNDNHRFGNMAYVILNQSFGNHTISLQYKRDRTATNTGPHAGQNIVDDTNSVGGAVEIRPFKKLIIDAGGYYYDGGKADDFTEDGVIKDMKVVSGTAEVIYSISKKWLAVARFDWNDTLDSNAFQEQYVASLQYYPASNVKLNLEYTNLDISAGGSTGGGAAGTATTEDQKLIAAVTVGF